MTYPHYAPAPVAKPKLSPIGFGAGSWWARPMFDRGEAIAVARHAVANGVRYIDTAPSYGDGEAEMRLGEALAGGRGDAVTVSTKFGSFHRAGRIVRDFDPQLLAASVDGSRRRLKRDVIDILLLHGPQPEDLTPALIDALIEMREHGLVARIGLSSWDTGPLTRALEAPFDAAMLQYNVFDRSQAGLAAKLRDAGRTVLNATTMGQGIFAPKNFLPTSKKNIWYLLRALKNDPVFALRAVRYRKLCDDNGVNPAHAAIQFVLTSGLFDSAVIGTTQIKHLDANLAYAEQTIDPTVVAKI